MNEKTLASSSKPKWSLGAWIAVSTTVFSVYGFVSWFFPSDSFVAITSGPVVIAGLFAAFLLCRSLRVDEEHYKRYKMRKPFLCMACFSFIPIFLWIAVVIGVPAFITNVLGPNTEMIATISIKNETGRRRSCDYRLGLEGYSVLFKDTFCVSEDIFRRVQVGQQVSLLVRRDLFGTRIFEIQTTKKANQSLNRTRAAGAALTG